MSEIHRTEFTQHDIWINGLAKHLHAYEPNTGKNKKPYMLAEAETSHPYQVIHERIDPFWVCVVLRGANAGGLRQHGVLQALGRLATGSPKSAGRQAEAVLLHVLDLQTDKTQKQQQAIDCPSNTNEFNSHLFIVECAVENKPSSGRCDTLRAEVDR